MKQEEIDLLKKGIRKMIREKKKTFPLEKAISESELIFREVELLPQFKDAKVLLAYWSLPDEVITHKFVQKWAEYKKIALPVIVGDTLELRCFGGLSKLEATNSFGVMEPKTEELVDPKEIDLAIIPGVAFDRKGNRLGRGKGYYDRFLSLTTAYKVAVGYDFQIIDEVPVASFDIPVDIVITSKN